MICLRSMLCLRSMICLLSMLWSLCFRSITIAITWLAGQVMEPGNTRERFDATVEGAVTAAVAGEFN
jgi:hypothetical protein